MTTIMHVRSQRLRRVGGLGHRSRPAIMLGLGLTVLAGAAWVPPARTAHAQVDSEERRPGPLDGAPAVRHRRELRSGRFELGAGMGSTIAQPFYNSLMANLKLAMHISDWLSVSVVGAQAVTALSTGLTDSIESSLSQMPSDSRADARAPTRQEALNGMNKIDTMIAAQLELRPITGKFSLFGRFFAHYDLYAFGGIAVLNLKADGAACGATPMATCPVTGFKGGPSAPTVGVGFHAFINDLMAINLELRDVMFRNNPSGRDVNADGITDDHDLQWTNNFFLMANLQFFLPGTAKISD